MPWNRSTPRPRSPRAARLPQFDALETRQLLATSPASVANLSNPSYDGLIGAAAVRNSYNVDGAGLAAAVVDTGIDYTHPGLGGGFGAGRKVEGGYDFAMSDADPRAETWSHGTMVAGLIASSAPEAPGVAPGADLVALRVFGNDNQGNFDAIADALQYVVDHHDEQHISVVNLSLSDGGNYKSNPFSFTGFGSRISGLIGQLRDLKIPVVAASGNSFDGQSQGMGYLAVLPKTISVTAADGSDHLLGDAQRLSPAAGGASATDLAAPGASLRTTGESGGYASVSGTSFAAPLVSGAVVLLQSIYKARFGTLPAVADLESWLSRGATTISDPATGASIGRLDIAKAASLIPAAPASTPAPVRTQSVAAVPTPTPAPDPTVAPASTPVVVAAPPVTPAPDPTPAPAPTPAPVTVAVVPSAPTMAAPAAAQVPTTTQAVLDRAQSRLAARAAASTVTTTTTTPVAVIATAEPTPGETTTEPGTGSDAGPEAPAVITTTTSRPVAANQRGAAAAGNTVGNGTLAAFVAGAQARERRLQALQARGEARAGIVKRWADWLASWRSSRAQSRPVEVARLATPASTASPRA